MFFIFFYLFFFRSPRKQKLGILCKSFATYAFHMKCQAFFSDKYFNNNNHNNKVKAHQNGLTVLVRCVYVLFVPRLAQKVGSQNYLGYYQS